MYFHFYLRKGVLYLPTMGKMDKGFYRDVEPVSVVDASNREPLRDALTAMIARGNPVVPMLKRRDWPPPVVLKYAGVKSWPAFERGMMLWGTENKDGVFQIIGKRKKPDGSTVDDPEQTITFPAGSSVEEVVNRVVKIVQDEARQQAE